VSETLLAERRGDVLWLTLNRPDAHNALDRALTDRLAAEFEDVGREGRVRAVVLTGAGNRTFCAGADLKQGLGGGERSPFSGAAGENPLVRLYRAMRTCHKPIVGRVNGSAFGGGLGLVAACDLVYAADHARFGTPEVRVGVFPLMITTFLIRQLPRRRYWEMAFLGEPLGAAEAERYHLVNRAVPEAELDARIADVLERLRAASPSALRVGKAALDVMQDMTVDQTLAYAEVLIEKLAASDDAQEGMAAFAERRTPRWAAGPEGKNG